MSSSKVRLTGNIGLPTRTAITGRHTNTSYGRRWALADCTLGTGGGGLAQAGRLRAEQAQAAALDERARIARETHDVLAHSHGALGLQIQVAPGRALRVR